MNAVTVRAHLDKYLCEQRALGFKLVDHLRACYEFVRYLEHQNHQGPLRVEQMAEWAKRDKHQTGDPATWARRLKKLRPFMRYLQQFEPLTEVPDFSIFGSVPERGTPHIFQEQEIVDLLTAARALESPSDLRGIVYETLFGLLASCGLRVCEATSLRDQDVDLRNGVLTIRQAKFGKSRQIPLHPTTLTALRTYRKRRDRHIDATPDAPFFIACRGKLLGKQLNVWAVDRTFAMLRKQLRWENRGTHHAARVHDLRHTFALRRVMLWQRQGTDIDQAMLALSTYMGHTKISNTYWYLTAIPELIALAVDKLERVHQKKEIDHG